MSYRITFGAKLWLYVLESPRWGKRRRQLLRGPSILMVKLTKSQSWWWRWRRAGNSRGSLLLQGKGNLALSAAFLRVSILSLSCQTFSEPAAILIVYEVLPGTSHDSCSVLYVVLGPKRREETAVSMPLGESSPQKVRGRGVHWLSPSLCPQHPPLECRQAARGKPKHRLSESPG